MAEQPGPADYPTLARTQLASRRSGVLKKLRVMAARTVPEGEKVLRFDLAWGLVSNAFVEAWPRDGAGEATTDRRPFGELLEVSPPPGREDDPDAYREDRPAIARLVVDALADWWEGAGGADHAIPVVARVEDDPLRVFDLIRREWRTDEDAVRVAGLAAAIRTRLRPMLADRLRGPIVETLREKIGRVTRREDCHALFAVSDEDGPYRVTFQMHLEPGARTVVRQLTLLTPARLRPALYDPAMEWEGVDREAIAQDLLHELLADAWQEAGGHDFPIHALLGHLRDDDFATWDMVERRPHTDSMGRAYRR